MDTFAKRLIMALEERDMKAAELSRQAKIFTVCPHNTALLQ